MNSLKPKLLPEQHVGLDIMVGDLICVDRVSRHVPAGQVAYEAEQAAIAGFPIGKWVEVHNTWRSLGSDCHNVVKNNSGRVYLVIKNYDFRVLRLRAVEASAGKWVMVNTYRPNTSAHIPFRVGPTHCGQHITPTSWVGNWKEYITEHGWDSIRADEGSTYNFLVRCGGAGPGVAKEVNEVEEALRIDGRDYVRHLVTAPRWSASDFWFPRKDTLGLFGSAYPGTSIKGPSIQTMIKSTKAALELVEQVAVSDQFKADAIEAKALAAKRLTDLNEMSHNLAKVRDDLASTRAKLYKAHTDVSELKRKNNRLKHDLNLVRNRIHSVLQYADQTIQSNKD
ncbi:hypothetical protein FDH29_gp16 [Aquamicrobium phage P14]|uniref:Uncharacterized protein n=1 Tax=Aquamicrobium phage P14 TaxID=1927013 RepID=A0A1L5C041_9CAUD|nr:hypothetical protein FDH29_gp16 [Aquamicrobium phage P14]APL99474.1 hypothetical protein BB738_0160 [Aquamicrobium phage P14]